jgi:hypothetical protein
MPYALVVGAGLVLGGTDHISWNIDFLASAGAFEYWRGAGEAVVTAARRVLQNAAETRDFAKSGGRPHSRGG